MARIAFLIGSLYEGASGIRVVVEGLSRELDQLGHEVCVFGGVSASSETEFPENWNGAKSKGYVNQGPRKFGYNRQMYRDVAAFKPDIVHLHGSWQYISIVAARLKKKTGATLVVSPHGSLAKSAMTQSSLQKKLARLLYQDGCFDAADGLHVTCQSERDELRSCTDNPNITIIRNGIDKPDFKLPAYEKRDNKVIALCRMEPKKGLEELIAAWKLVEAQKPDWVLEIRGPDRQQYRQKLEELVREHGLRNLHICDAAYGSRKFAAIAFSKLFILSSRNENFGMTVAEALSLETPVIATTGSPWAGLESQKCGWWVECEPTVLADALLVAIEQPNDTLMAMGKNGRAWMEKDFQWTRIAQEFSDYYEILRNEQGAGANLTDRLV